MTLFNKKLNKVRRDYMTREIAFDISENRMGTHDCLNHSGNFELPDLLLEAATAGDEKSLARELKSRQCMRVYDAVSNGKSVSLCRVSDEDYELFSKDTFDTFYLRGVCLEAASKGCQRVILKDDAGERVYRTEALLNALRNNEPIEKVLGIERKEKRLFKVEYRI